MTACVVQEELVDSLAGLLIVMRRPDAGKSCTHTHTQGSEEVRHEYLD